jgi:hypothetical protein
MNGEVQLIQLVPGEKSMHVFGMSEAEELLKKLKEDLVKSHIPIP